MTRQVRKVMASLFLSIIATKNSGCSRFGCIAFEISSSSSTIKPNYRLFSFSSSPTVEKTLFTTTSKRFVSASRTRPTTTACILRSTTTSSSTSSSSIEAEKISSNNDNLIFLNGIRDVVDRYDVFLLDMWGVMHDGFRPYDGVLDVVQKLRQANKQLIILSNSSKRQDNAIKMLNKLGFNPNDDFQGIITSGEVAYQMLSGNNPDSCEPWSVISKLRDSDNDSGDKRKVFVYGSGDDDEPYCESCGWTLAPLEEATLIVARGTFTINDGTGTVIHKRHDGETAYETALAQTLAIAAEKRIPMIVCNPDKVRPDAERPPMPGKIGDMYEHVLLSINNNADNNMSPKQAEALVKRIGKPFTDVYDIAIRMCEPLNTDDGKFSIDLSRVCMVGDALETDVAGGSMVGIDTLWILKDGVYGPELLERIQNHSNNNEDDNINSNSNSNSNSNGIDDILVDGAKTILESFNKMEGTYAKDRQLSPTFILPHFRW